MDCRSRVPNRRHRAQFPWENGYIKHFHTRLRDELLHGEKYYTLKEVQVMIEAW